MEIGGGCTAGGDGHSSHGHRHHIATGSLNFLKRHRVAPTPRVDRGGADLSGDLTDGEGVAFVFLSLDSHCIVGDLQEFKGHALGRQGATREQGRDGVGLLNDLRQVLEERRLGSQGIVGGGTALVGACAVGGE